MPALPAYRTVLRAALLLAGLLWGQCVRAQLLPLELPPADSLLKQYERRDSLAKAVEPDTVVNPFVKQPPKPVPAKPDPAAEAAARRKKRELVPGAVALTDTAAQKRWRYRRLATTGLPNRRAATAMKNALYLVRDPGSSDSLARRAEAAARHHGYAEARVDSLRPLGRTLYIHATQGPVYVWDSLSLNPVNPVWLRNSRLENLTRRHAPFCPECLQLRMRELLANYENTGYPFARFTEPALRLYPRPHTADTVGVGVVYEFQAGPVVKIDSVRVEGKIREKPKFVQRLVRIRTGDLYNHENITAIPRLLDNSIYYQNTQPPKIIFRGRGATIVISTERKKSNRLDGLVGLLPPKNETEKFDFTVLLDFQLVSAFKAGEVITLHWDKLPGSSQNLDARYLHPYLFGTGFKVEMRFNLFKKDTLFLNLRLEPAVYYEINPMLSVRAFYRNDMTSLLSATPYKEVAWPPPPVLSSTSHLAGAGLIWDNVDYKLNPSRGLYIKLDYAVGQKRLSPDPALEKLEVARLVQTQLRQEASLEAWWYRTTFRRQVLVLGARGWWLGLDQYFENDMQYIGGARSLRGFNENEFPVSMYGLGTLEYRFQLSRHTYLGAFVDAGWMEYRLTETATGKYALGTGVMLSLRTPIGNINVSYAVGQTETQPINFVRGRVHLGLVNNF